MRIYDMFKEQNQFYMNLEIFMRILHLVYFIYFFVCCQ